MKLFFLRIYSFFSTRRSLAIILFFLLLALCAFFSLKLQLKNDISDMLPNSKQQNGIQNLITQNRQLDKIIAIVTLKDSTKSNPDLLIDFTEHYISSVQQADRAHLIGQIEARQDEEDFLHVIKAIQNNLPWLLDSTDYPYLDSLIEPAHVQEKLAADLRQLSAPGGVAMKYLLADDPLGFSIPVMKKLQELKLDEQMDWYDGYLFSQQGKTLTFFIHSRYPSSQTKPNQALAELLAQTRNHLLHQPEYAGLAFHYFGGQLVAAGNATQMQQDTRLTLGITIALLLVLFIVFFRSWSAPFLIMIPVIFGGLFGTAMMALVLGKVSLIALGASSVILGIAVNYSIHFLSHYRHSGDKAETIHELCLPMTIGSFTTIAAFLSLYLLQTPVLQQLGLFTAFNLIGSSFCTLIFLPHFIPSTLPRRHQQPNWLDRFSKGSTRYNSWITAGILLLTICLSCYSGKVRFNEDLMKMNYMDPELQTSQDHIQARNAESFNSLFCISEGKNLDEALNHLASVQPRLDSLKQQHQVRKYTRIGSFLLSDSIAQHRLQQWNAFWTPAKKEQLLHAYANSAQALGLNLTAFRSPAVWLLPDHPHRAQDADSVFRHLFRDLIQEDRTGVHVLTLLKVTQSQRKQVLHLFSDSHNPVFTDRQAVTQQWVHVIQDDFYKILFLTSFMVFFTILLSYGRIELALISFLPMVLTWICILGLMGLLGIEFNIINIIISTLIFGLGDDYSIFITDGLLEKYKYGKQKIHSVQTSIYLSAITTIIGLGILLFAKHPALKSIAGVSVIGILSILLVSQTLQPFLFDFFIQRRADKKRPPYTAWSFIKTSFGFLYYLMGCLLLTTIGFLLTRCIPVARPRMKYYFHVCLSKGMQSLMYIMGNVRKELIHPERADWNKPAVLIANHSSFLDLVRIISLHPRILLLTNRWVWRSPVFGWLVRMADYYPVEEGAAYSVAKLREWVARGYSVAVFPEGTRSYDDQIGRFHKGAFYLAQELQLDLQPILLHGIGYKMRKGDYMLKNGEIVVEFLPRIAFNDQRFGNTLAEKARLTGAYFRKEYERLRASRQNVDYFREQLIHQYLYKGPVLEWYTRIKTRMEHNYRRIEALVPADGHILDLGCGYGFLDYILCWTSANRSIQALDYDEEKIAIATHAYLREDRLQFIHAQLPEWQSPRTYDCILMLDMLHYLTPDNQAILLEKIYTWLAPGGIFILRDGIAELQQRIKGTRLTEFFSTQVFRFNKKENELHYIKLEDIKSFAHHNELSLQVIDDTTFTANLLLVMKKSSLLPVDSQHMTTAI